MEKKLTIDQKKENTTLPLLKQELREVEKSIKNMLDAIQNGIFTSSTKQRLEELEARKKAEAEKRKARLKAEKDARFQEVIEAYRHADALRDAVVEDYGYFTYETEEDIPSIWELFFKR